MGDNYDLRQVSTDLLCASLQRLLSCHHQVTADIIAHLAEVDARKLYLDHACSSMFTYSVQRLHMSEPTAYKRIEAARTARRFPVIFAMVAAGDLHLTGVALLAAKLTEENHQELLAAAKKKSKREIEKLLAARFPRADVPAGMRKMPEQQKDSATAEQSSPAPQSVTPPTPMPTASPGPNIPVSASSMPEASFTLTSPSAKRPEVKPLSEERYYLKLTVSRQVHDKLLEAQGLLRHRLPSGDLEVVVERALDSLLEDLRRDKFGETASQRSQQSAAKERSRHIPNEVKREVIARDGCQCSFIDEEGNRCQERGYLEFDHVKPYGKGGGNEAGNIRVLCHGHNAHAAAKEYGADFMRGKVTNASAGGGRGS